MTTSISARLLLASRLAYNMQPDGSLVAMANQAEIGIADPVQSFILGPNRIDAALFGIAPDALILAFRGTIMVESPDPLSRLADWLCDGDAELIPGANLPGRVHRGFCSALDELWPSIEPIVATALADPANGQKALYVTGHSKGGSMAFLAAARIAATLIPNPPPFPMRIQCVTFAAARPGDADFASGFNKLVPHAVRYEYQDDIVTHLAPGELLVKGLQALPKLRGLTITEEFLFESAGTLAFFDWQDTVQTDSLELTISRVGHLLQRAAEDDFDGIIEAHSIGPNSGYAKNVFAPALPL